MSLTVDLIRLARSRPSTQEDLEAAALFVLDTLACAAPGPATPQGQILVDYGRTRGSDTAMNVFTLAGLAHILEMDDLHKASVTHPGCVVIPAAWFVALEEGANGHELLRAILEGYEVSTRVGMAVGKKHYRVWHNTSTCGPFGAAMAAAGLLRLDDEQAAWALGNAGTQAFGLWQFLEEGAMSKHLHTARAAEAGLIAAELAARGFTGPRKILEGDKGFFRALCPDPHPEAVLADHGPGWQLSATSIKPWPSCRHTHPAIDAALEVHEAMAGARVASAVVETYGAALDLCDRETPRSEYEAKFSLQHCVAAAMTDGGVALDSFDEAARSRLSGPRRLVSVEAGSDFESAYPARWGARVSARDGAGRTVVAERTACLGDPEAPIPRDDLIRKAHMLLVRSGLSGTDSNELIGAVLALADNGPLPDVTPLFS